MTDRQAIQKKEKLTLFTEMPHMLLISGKTHQRAERWIFSGIIQPNESSAKMKVSISSHCITENTFIVVIVTTQV